MEEANGKRQEHRLTSLEKDVEYIKEKQDTNHKELMSEFRSLREKVNEEITTMHDTIVNNRKFLIRLMVLALIFGSFLWIKESRDWFLSLLGFVL